MSNDDDDAKACRGRRLVEGNLRRIERERGGFFWGYVKDKEETTICS